MPKTAAPVDVSTTEIRTTMGQIAPDLLTGVGIAYIAYISQWSHVLTLGPSDLFWMTSPPAPMRYAALILSTTILGILTFAAIRAARSRGHLAVIGRLLLIVFGVLSVNSVRDLLSNYYPDEFGGNILRSMTVVAVWGILAIFGVISVVLFTCAVKYVGSIVVGLLRYGLIATSILGFWNMGRAAYIASGGSPVSTATVRAPFLPTKATGSPKVVWLVFDELDYRLLFVDRKDDVKMPVLSDLKKTAVMASQSYPPSGATSNSMLTYLLGERVISLHPNGADDLYLRTVEHPERRSWKQLPNLFSKAREAGVNGAVVGWYLPYSKLLRSDVVDAWWFSKVPRDDAIGSSLGQMLLNQPRALFETSLLSPFGQSILTKQRVLLFNEFMDKTRQLLRDDRVGLLLLHVPVPHTPYFYDRRTRQNTLSNSTISGYWDALALVDKILGDVQTEMKAVGAWERSTILISSDHYYRTAMRLDGRMDHRIPFLLKMPKQDSAFAFEKPFNSQLSHHLVLDILRGKVQTGEQAVRWLETFHSTIPAEWGPISVE